MDIPHRNAVCVENTNKRPHHSGDSPTRRLSDCWEISLAVPLGITISQIFTLNVSDHNPSLWMNQWNYGLSVQIWNFCLRCWSKQCPEEKPRKPWYWIPITTKKEDTWNCSVSICSQIITVTFNLQRNHNLHYGRTSNISQALEGYKIVDHSDLVGASPIGAAPTTSSFSN